MRHLIIFGVFAFGFSNSQAVSQTNETYYLRITPFESQSPKDSLALLIELRFWQEFRERAEKSETVQIVGGWDQIVELLEYTEEIVRTPGIFDTSTIQTPAMKSPSHHLTGSIRPAGSGTFELDLQIMKISTGEQVATERANIPLQRELSKDETTPALRRLVLKLLEPLDPKLQKQKSWLGEPFDQEKINILVADFTNTAGEVDKQGRDWATKTFNELDQFMKADAALQEVVEVKRLFSKGSDIVIREETRAKEVGEELNADMIIWGQNLCVKDSICYFTKALITHEARTTSTLQEGVLHQTQLLRADLPMLIGAEANVLVKFIIGWTYLNDRRHKQFQQALIYLQQALKGLAGESRKDLLIWAGNAGLDAGRYDLALTWYTELEKLQKEAWDRRGLGTTYNNIGLIYDKKGEWDKALDFYGRSESILKEVGDRATLAKTYNNIGAIYDKKGEWDKALDFYGRSESIRKEVGDRAGLATTYNNIGGIYSKKGEWDKALDFYGRSESIRKEVGDRAGLATTYNNIGGIYDKKGEWDKALEFYGRSESILKEVGDKAHLAPLYNNIGAIYSKKGDWDKALEFYHKDEAISKEVGDRAGLAATYNNIGLIYSKKGDWDKALEFYGRSESILIEVGDKAHLAPLYNNIGLIYSTKGDWDKALEFYHKDEAISKEVGDRAGLAATYNNIGAIYSKKGDWGKALEFYGKSEAILIEVGDNAHLAPLYNNIGSIYSNKGDWDKALEFYGRSESIRKEVGDKAGLATTYNNIAAAYRKKDNLQQALAYGQRSLEISRQVGNLIGENSARFGLAQTLAGQKKYSEAVTHLERCVEIDRQLNHPNLKNDQQWLLFMQLRAYSETGTRYEMLEQTLARLNDLQKADLFRGIKDWQRATRLYQSHLKKNADSLRVAEQASLQNLIGIGYIKQSQGDSALIFLEPALQTFQDLGDKEMVGSVYNNLGSANKVRKVWPEALEWLRKSAFHNRTVAGDSVSVLGFTYYHLANIFYQTSKPDSARHYINKSLSIREMLDQGALLKETKALEEKILALEQMTSK